MTRYRVLHRTSYEYEAPVLHAHHLAHLRPRSTDTQMVESTRVVAEPAPSQHRRMVDYFGNDVIVRFNAEKEKLDFRKTDLGFKDLDTKESSLEDIFVRLIHDGDAA